VLEVKEQLAPETVPLAEAAVTNGGTALARVRRIWAYVHERETLLWWLHSCWSFLFGVGVMILGAKKPAYVRIIVFHIGFIWATSLFLPVLIRLPWLSGVWSERVRLVINYFNKNFYQQLLFFVIPVYYASTTFSSRNVVFLIVLCLSAVLSTLDVVYDRYLSVHWPLTALFLSFNSFACINVMLLVMFPLRIELALYLAAAFAVAIFTSMLHRFGQLRGQSLWIPAAATGLFVLFFLHLTISFIPPVMVSLGKATFGPLNLKTYRIKHVISELPAGFSGRLVALTPIKAPFGLTAKVRHKWYLDGWLVWTHPKPGYDVVRGGRREGYRYWSYLTIPKDPAPRTIRVDVETSSGQLIGRAILGRATEE